MFDEKMWSYAEITGSTENEIFRLMQRVAESPDGDQALVLRSMASGVYFGWARLTADWKKAGDDSHLRALAQID